MNVKLLFPEDYMILTEVIIEVFLLVMEIISVRKYCQEGAIIVVKNFLDYWQNVIQGVSS